MRKSPTKVEPTEEVKPPEEQEEISQIDILQYTLVLKQLEYELIKLERQTVEEKILLTNLLNSSGSAPVRKLKSE